MPTGDPQADRDVGDYSFRRDLNDHEGRIDALEQGGEDWHVVGDSSEPDFLTVETKDGPQLRWIQAGAAFPGAGSAWTPDPGSYQAEHKSWDVPPLAFYKDPFGVVHLRGGAVGLAAPYSLWAGATAPSWEEAEASGEELREGQVFTLPTGYRPDAQVLGSAPKIIIEEGAFGSTPYHVTILPSGLVLLGAHVEGGVGLADDITCFDGISFRAAP